MTRIGIIRCEKNEHACPLTGCFTCLGEGTQGFRGYGQARLMGVFTCRCAADNGEDLARILKAKGAEGIHLPTCLRRPVCPRFAALPDRVRRATGLPCVPGTAHLPDGYVPVP